MKATQRTPTLIKGFPIGPRGYSALPFLIMTNPSVQMFFIKWIRATTHTNPPNALVLMMLAENFLIGGKTT
jgi:hypothetical protein